MSLISTQPSNNSAGQSRFKFSIPTVQPTIKQQGINSNERSDGRNAQEFRKVCVLFNFDLFYYKKLVFRTGIVSQASGSSYIEIGKTKIVCSVYGPRPIKKDLGVGNFVGLSLDNIAQKRGHVDFSEKATVTCDFKFATFSNIKNLISIEQKESEMSSLISETLELSIIRENYPKSTIDINILVLEDDGSCLTSSITCASIALAHAGIMSFDLVPSCTIVCSYKKLKI